jgi:amino acid adenylation domain-containing protein
MKKIDRNSRFDSIRQIIAAQASNTPAKSAISAPGRSPLGYAQLQVLIETNLAILNHMGIGRGDRVAIVLPNGPEMATAFLTIAAGATAAPLNPAYQAPEFEFYLGDLNAKALLLQVGMDSPARQVATQLAIPIIELIPCPDQAAGVFTLNGSTVPATGALYAEPNDEALVLHTSGTTSKPKIVPLSQRNICSSAHNIVATLALTADDRCLNIMPLFHIHGLMAAIMASITAGAEVICSSGFNRDRFFGWLHQCRPSWYTAVPTMHMSILDAAAQHREAIKSAPLRFLRSSSASLPPQVMLQLEDVFNAPVIEAYGMTEAAHQMASNPLPPDVRKAGSVGRAAGPDVAIMDEAGVLLTAGETGEIVIRGDNVTSGYESNPQANANAFCQGWFRTGDQGRMDEEGYLYITGRLKEIINRGGEKISPRELDEALLDHPDVLQAVAFAVPHDSLGEDVAVAVVLKANATVTANELRQGLFVRLAEFKIPNRILVVDEIPKGPTGKVQRIGMADKLAGQFQDSYTAPRNTTEELLAEIFKEGLSNKRIGVHENFFSAGGDSLSGARVISKICSLFLCDLPITTLFVYPTIAELAQEINQTERPERPTILQRNDSAFSPLSFAQQRLWFIDQLNPGHALYNIAHKLHFHGPLDIQLLQRCLNHIICRHEGLRTTFTEQNGHPVQLIHPAQPLELTLLDFTNQSLSTRESQLQEQIVAEAGFNFNLQLGPLIRGTVIRLAEQEHVVILVLHHIIFDGWSMGILCRELEELYEDFGKAEPSPLPKLPIQYSDFAILQRAQLQGETLAYLVDYWRRALGNAPELKLPLGRHPAGQTDYTAGRLSMQLSPELSDALKSLALKQNCTLFMVLIASFKLLLHRHTGQEDIIIGAPTAARHHPQEIKSLIGFFVNTMVLRSDLSGTPTFSQLLDRVRDTLMSAYRNSDLPFDTLVEKLQPVRKPGQTPFINIMFNYLDAAWRTIDLSGMTSSRIEMVEQYSSFPITIYAIDYADGLKLEVKYQRDHFDIQHIDNLLDQYRYLLEQVTENTHRQLHEYSLLTPSALCVLPDPGTELASPKVELVAVAFTSWVKQAPDNIAVTQGNRSWTYRTLFDRAQSIAAHLHSLNLTPGDVVAVTGHKNFGLISAIMAVLMTRGVLLTVDSNLPQARQKLLLDEAKAKYLISANSESTHFCQDSHLTITLVSIDPDTALHPSHKNNCAIPILSPSFDDPAYIFFTSGTTGKPKGVLGSHKGLGHFIDWQRNTFDIGPGDRCAQLTHLSFDVVLRDLFLPLTSGATLCLPEAEITSERIFDWLATNSISVLHTVPSLAQSWLEVWPDQQLLPSLRWAFFAGEPLTDTLVKHWRQKTMHSGAIVNLYGPTETTLVKCYYRVPEESLPGIQPLGRPLPQTQILVIGKNRQPCGINEPGELVIRTPFMTLGYINSAEIQRSGFTTNPFSNNPSDQVYYTGDYGYCDHAGLLHILGRRDHQIKINGVRIEPDEITNILASYEAIKSCLIIGRREADGNSKLIAYLVPHNKDKDTVDQTRLWLSRHLPTSMVPGAYVLLDRMPLKANGKIDRNALEGMDTVATTSRHEYKVPRTATEIILANIWKTVLGCENVGTEDNFFELGGHSLLATQIIARINTTFGLQMPLPLLFRYPTIAELVQEISQNEQSEQSTILHRKNRAFSPLSLAQQRLWFVEQLEPEHSINNVTRTLHLRGHLDQGALEFGIKEIIERHEIMRTTFSVHDDEAMQHIAPNMPFTITAINLKHLSPDQQKDEAKRIAMSEAHHSFDLTRSPLIRAVLLQLGQREHVLIITLHHIIFDGWSMGIFSSELEAFYRSILLNDPAELPEPVIQYADYAEWQRDWLQGDAITPLIDYWKKQLANATCLELPADRPRAKQPDYNTALCSFQLSAELTTKIRRMGQEENCTLFMTILTCFNVLLHRYTGETDIVIGAPISGRHGLDKIKDIIGCFVNTLALRTDLSGDPSFRQMLRRVREMALEAYKHSALPFDKLVEILRPERQDRRNPLFDIMINIHEASWYEFRLDGLDIEAWRLAEPLTDFALSLDVLLENERLHLNLKYHSALFDEWRINNMLGHIQTLLEGCVANPDQSIATLPLLTVAEHQQIVKEWNNTGRKFPSDKSIHTLFEQQTQATPDAVALIFENQQLTYRELNARANQLAHLLIARGIEIEQTVALLMDRSMELLIAILAILKAGGAYLPLDPQHPLERLQTILDDATPKFLLAVGSHQESLAGHLNVAVLNIDALQSELDATGKHNPDAPVNPDNVAYVLYTSGSTGIPKGVMIEHGAVINLACALQTQVFDNFDNRPFRVALNTAITFDASVQQWTRLLRGDCIIILPEVVSHDTPAFAAALRAQHADVLGCTPTQLRLLFDEGLFDDAGNCPAIVLCGGEAIDAELWRLASAHQRSHFYNVYGPTECTVDATCRLIDAKANVPNIGRPLANVQAYILDRNHQPVPVGIPGELWLGGAGVGRGYLNKPELTASSFTPDTYSNSSNARLYKTGDLTRYLPDGNIEYLGRSDFQVKLRGFRIELGEIESLLRQHASVKDALVILREDVAGDQRLTAYVIPEDSSNAQALTIMLKVKLPEYMVPSDIVFLETFPLTSSGKIDRKFLPQPAHDRSRLADQFIAPRTPYEKQLARIWSEIMTLENPGLHDNFFELGGHSLLATRVISRINCSFDTQLPLRNIFESPTIAELAQALLVNKARALQEAALTTLLDQLKNLTEAEAEQLFAEKTAGEKA